MANATLTRVLDDIKSLETEELRLVEQAIRERRPQPSSPDCPTAPTREQIDAANADLRNTIVTLPHTVGADNESIDRDLARASEDNHTDSLPPIGAK